MMTAVEMLALKLTKDEWNLVVLLMWTAFAVLIGVVVCVIADWIRETRAHMTDWRNGWEKEMQKELRKPERPNPKPPKR